jgi:hypothetical protein
MWIFFIIGLIGIIYFLNFYKDLFYNPIDTLPRNLYRGSNDELGIGVYFESAWLLFLMSVAYFIKQKFSLLRIENTAKRIGRGMIIIYYITITTGEDLAHFLNTKMDRHINFILLLFLYFLSGIFLSWLIDIIFSKKVEFSLIKKSS